MLIHREVGLIVVVLGLMGSRLELGGGCGWECREAFYGRLDKGSIGKDLRHGSPQRILIKKKKKKDSLWFQLFIAMVESKFIKPYPTFQGRPEIKYLLQGEMSGKESLLPMPARPLCTSLAWRSLEPM